MSYRDPAEILNNANIENAVYVRGTSMESSCIHT